MRIYYFVPIKCLKASGDTIQVYWRACSLETEGHNIRDAISVLYNVTALTVASDAELRDVCGIQNLLTVFEDVGCSAMFEGTRLDTECAIAGCCV